MALTKILEAGIKDGEIKDVDVNTSAGIARTKLANVDVVDDTSPQLGGFLASNGNNIAMADGDIIVVGTNNDLQISHASNVSQIRGATANDIKIVSAANFQLQHAETDGSLAENMIVATGDGAVELYWNGIKKFNTGDAASTVTGNLFISSGYINLNDNYSYAMGSGNKGQLYHDGNHQYLLNTVGNIYLYPKSGEKGIAIIPDNATELYYDGVKKAHTYADGFKVDGVQRNVTAGYNYLLIGSNDASGATLTLDGDSNGDGAGGDYAYIEHGSDGDLSIVCDNPAGDSQFELYVGAGSTTAIVAQASGEVQLYHNGGLKLNTDTYGIDVTGTSSVNAHVKIHGNNCLGRSYWGYSTGYSGTVIGRTDNSVGSTIFMGVDVTGNSSGSFGGQGNEIVFRSDHQFKTPNAANNNYNTPIRFGRGTSTEGAVNFPNGCLFGADQADVNILDDYEEGTWVPSTSEGAVGTNHGGYYTKVGRLVTCTAYITLQTSTSSASVRIDNFPFTNLNGSYAIGAAYCSFVGNHHFFMQMNPNATFAYPHYGIGHGISYATASGGYLLFTVTYMEA